jgi:hypothetical protein
VFDDIVLWAVTIVMVAWLIRAVISAWVNRPLVMFDERYKRWRAAPRLHCQD